MLNQINKKDGDKKPFRSNHWPQHSSALTLQLVAPFTLEAGCLICLMRHQHNPPCLMDAGHFEEKIIENFNFFFFSWGISHILSFSKDAAQGVQTNQSDSHWRNDESSVTEVSSSLVPLHQPIHSHHLKDHRICPMHFQRQLWKGQLAGKEKRQWFCLNMSPWRVGSPGKRKYQPGTVNAAGTVKCCEVTPDPLIMVCIMPFSREPLKSINWTMVQNWKSVKNQKKFPSKTWNVTFQRMRRIMGSVCLWKN